MLGDVTVYNLLAAGVEGFINYRRMFICLYRQPVAAII